jgi:sulfur carrier protein
MLVFVNGEAREVREGSSVLGLLDEMALPDGRGIAVAVDGEVVPRGRWESTRLSEEQAVEIVRAVQGG